MTAKTDGLVNETRSLRQTDWSVEHDCQDSLTGQWNMIPETKQLVMT